MRRRTSTNKHLTLRDLTLVEELCLLSAWSPPEDQHERDETRWSTWREFLADYEQVRDEVLELFGNRGGPLFAERVRAFVKTRGIHRLDAITCYEDLIATLDEFERVAV